MTVGHNMVAHESHPAKPLDQTVHPTPLAFSASDDEKNRNLSQLLDTLRTDTSAANPPPRSDSAAECLDIPTLADDLSDAELAAETGGGAKINVTAVIHWLISLVALGLAVGLAWYSWHLTLHQQTLLTRLLNLETQAAIAQPPPLSVITQIAALTEDSNALKQRLTTIESTLATLPAAGTQAVAPPATGQGLAEPEPTIAQDSAQRQPATPEETEPMPAAVEAVPTTVEKSPDSTSKAIPADSKRRLETPSWAVNLATLSNEASARRLVQSLAGQQGGEPELNAISTGDRPRYRVRLVGFLTREAAERAAHRMQRHPGLTGVSVSHE